MKRRHLDVFWKVPMVWAWLAGLVCASSAAAGEGWHCMAAAVDQYEIKGVSLLIKEPPITVVGPVSWSGRTKDLSAVIYHAAQELKKNVGPEPDDLVTLFMETRPEGDDHTQRLASDVLRIEVSEDLLTAGERPWYRWTNQWICHGRFCELRDPHTYDIWMGKGPQVYINWDCSRPQLPANTRQCSGPDRYEVTPEDRVVFTWQSDRGVLLLSCAEEDCSNCD